MTPRLFLLDDNIRDIGGHYFELATLLAEGGKSLGYQPTVVTNRAFTDFESVPPGVDCAPVFHPKRMIHWSLGVDGNSSARRDLNGNSSGLSPVRNAKQKLIDLLNRPGKRPRQMISAWATDFCEFVSKASPSRNDAVVVNTADDFLLLALAKGLNDLRCDDPLTIDLIFHFAVLCPKNESKVQSKRIKAFGEQVNECIEKCQPHKIRVHATTDGLTSQLKQAGVKVPINAIPYPTRQRLLSGHRSIENESGRRRIVLAGLPRAEKGGEAIQSFLSTIENDLLNENQFQVSMQMPAERWQSMIPVSMHNAFDAAASGNFSTDFNASNDPLDVQTENLTTDQYHWWLDSADVGLFLYDADRYLARCSGVLLEMMARGVPVIVPDGCWLSEQVIQAGGQSTIGLVYKDRSQIPELLKTLHSDFSAFRVRCRRHAKHIAKKHDGANTLLQLGIVDQNMRRQNAA